MLYQKGFSRLLKTERHQLPIERFRSIVVLAIKMSIIIHISTIFTKSLGNFTRINQKLSDSQEHPSFVKVPSMIVS